jgi:hypothetical protein
MDEPAPVMSMLSIDGTVFCVYRLSWRDGDRTTTVCSDWHLTPDEAIEEVKGMARRQGWKG